MRVNEFGSISTSLGPSCSTSSRFPLDKDAIILLTSHQGESEGEMVTSLLRENV